MSEGVQQGGGIDDIVELARHRMRSRVPGGTLPQMSQGEILGGGAADSTKTFNSYDELEAAQSRRDLPSPEENVKTLGDLMAKYRIGDDPDFKAQVFRLWPKTFENGIIAEGYYADYSQPLTEQMIAQEYGGGHYRVVIQGPRPNTTGGTKHYASAVVKIAGMPRTDRIPNRGVGAVPATPQMTGHAPRIESDGMVDKAFSTLHEVFKDERQERRDLEQRQLDSGRSVQDTINSLSNVHERYTQQLLESERAAYERERRLTEDRTREREERVADMERRFEQERRSAPDPLDTLTRAAGLFKGDGESSQRVLDSVLAKHRDEIAMMREESVRVNERIREANTHEAAAIREASRREVEAERTASQSRERELLRQVEYEREERRRDQDRFREDLANRDQAAKDRLEQARTMLETQMQARYDTMVAQSDLRLNYVKDDLERQVRELDELRALNRESKDPLTQMRQMKEFQESAQDILGLSSSSSSRGIGSEATPTVPSFDMGKVFEGLMERGPQYIEALGTLIRPSTPAAPQQPPPRPGQILSLPEGTFQVVQTAQGLGMVPYVQETPVPTRLAGQPQQRALPKPRQPMPDLDDLLPEEPDQKQAAPRTPRPAAPRPKAPPRPTKSTTPTTQAAPVPVPIPVKPAVEMPKISDAQKKQVVQLIEGLLNTAIMTGDEPEDLLAAVAREYPVEALRVIAQLDVDEALAQIREIHPASAVFTPGGIIFTRSVFNQLRAMVQ